MWVWNLSDAISSILRNPPKQNTLLKWKETLREGRLVNF